MTKEIRSPNVENSQLCGRRFRHSDLVIPSDFVIRHSDLRIAVCSIKRPVSGLVRAAGGGNHSDELENAWLLRRWRQANQAEEQRQRRLRFGNSFHLLPKVKSSNKVTLSALVQTPTAPASWNVSSSHSSAALPSKVTLNLFP